MRTVFTTYAVLEISTVDIVEPSELCPRCDRPMAEFRELQCAEVERIDPRPEWMMRYHLRCAFSYFGYRPGE